MKTNHGMTARPRTPTHASRFQPRVECLEQRTLLTAGMLDPTFGADGKLVTPIGAGDDSGYSVALQSDGKFVIAGSADMGGGFDFAVTRHHADGTLDTSFAGDGKLTTDIGSNNDQVFAVAVQFDGKIVVAGFTFISAGNLDFALARFNADGSLDLSFSGDGRQVIAFGSFVDQATSLAIQPDGKIVVAGLSHNGSDFDFAVTRLNTNGSLDTSFDGDGKLTTSLGSFNDEALGVALQPDGAIVVAGRTFNGSNTDFAVVRLNADGSLDPTFDGDGMLTTSFGSSLDEATSVVVQPDGRIVVAGYTVIGGTSAFALARFNPDGSLDTSFDGDGRQTATVGVNSDTATSMALQADGKIVVAGWAWTGGSNDLAVARFQANGTLDTSFDGDGRLTTTIGAGNDIATGVVVQADGRILVAGFSANGSDQDFAVVRYQPDGSLDRLSDGPGFVTTDFGTGYDIGTSMAIQLDGKLIVAGYSTLSTGVFAVARYHPDGTLDISFDGDGKVSTAIGSISARAFGVAVQTDGKIVVAGHASNGSDFDFAIVRYHTDGSLDTSFDGDGITTTPIGSSDDYVSSVAIQADGKIVVSGYMLIAGVPDFAVVRYNPDGSLDGSFDSDGVLTTAVSSSSDRATSLTLQADGKIVVAGFSGNGSDNDMALVRYLTNGSLDTSFDSDGIVTTAIGSSEDYAFSVAIQADGKVVIAGAAIMSSGVNIALARYNSNGTLDVGFDGDGKVTTSISLFGASANSVFVQSDGKIVVAGGYTNTTNEDVMVVRYHANGAIDTTFGGGGIFTTPIGTEDDIGACVALQADGHIVVAGQLVNGSDSDFALVRVRGDNRDPVPLPASFTLNEDTSLTVSTPTYYYDPDSNVVTTALLSGPAHGTLALNPYGQFVYTPFANYSGVDRFSYRLSDSFGGMAVGSVELHVTDSNDAPTALNDFTILTRNSLATAIDVLANDSTAPDLGETLSITTVTQPANGTVVITGGGAGLTYQPNTAFTGLDFFTYLIDDGHGGTAPGNVSVNVVTVPLISFDTAFSSGSEKTKTVTITVNLFPPRLAPTTVEYAVVGGDATLIDDFKLLGTGVLKFKANRTTAKIELTVKNDTISDPYETVVVGLSNSSFGYSIGPIGQHTYTIIDDESIPSAPARFAADALFGLPWTGRKGKRWGLTPDSH